MKRLDFDARGALLAAAKRTFAEYGFEGATAGMIAARAGVTAGLVNYHFGGKEKLYAAVLDDALRTPPAPGPGADALSLLTAIVRSALSARAAADDTVRRLLAWEAMRPSDVGGARVAAWRARRRAMLAALFEDAHALAPAQADAAALWLDAVLGAIDPDNPMGAPIPSASAIDPGALIAASLAAAGAARRDDAPPAEAPSVPRQGR